MFKVNIVDEGPFQKHGLADWGNPELWVDLPSDRRVFCSELS